MAFQILDVDPLGPLIQIGVRVGTRFAAAGLGGAPKSYTALIDTGASSTAISPKVVSEVRPQLTGSTPIGRAGASLIADMYDVRIKFEHHRLPGTWYDLTVVEVSPANQGVDILIGRDLLKNATMLYDGSNGKLYIKF
jgi:predicted aspartyl protease